MVCISRVCLKFYTQSVRVSSFPFAVGSTGQRRSANVNGTFVNVHHETLLWAKIDFVVILWSTKFKLYYLWTASNNDNCWPYVIYNVRRNRGWFGSSNCTDCRTVCTFRMSFFSPSASCFAIELKKLLLEANHQGRRLFRTTTRIMYSENV